VTEEEITPKQKKYREWYVHTKYWKWMRMKVAERADFQCQVKGCKRVGPGLNAHHTTYYVFGINVLFLEWLFFWIMVYLCPEHHARTHSHHSLTLRNGKRLKPFGHKY